MPPTPSGPLPPARCGSRMRSSMSTPPWRPSSQWRRAPRGRSPVTGFSLADVERIAGADAARAEQLLARCARAGLDGDCGRPARRAAGASRDARGCGGGRVASAAVDGRAVAGATTRFEQLERACDALPGRSVRGVRSAAAPRRPPPRRPPATRTCKQRGARAARWSNVPRSRSTGRSTARSSRRSALTFGADDVDGVSPLEDETGEGRRRAPLEEIRRNIGAAGCEPVERDGRFEPRR